MIRCPFFFILIVVFWGCTKEELPFEKEYPVIETLPATDIDSTGLTLNARIIGSTAADLTDYGFQLYLKLFPSYPVDTAFLNSSQVVLSQNNVFSIRLSHNLSDRLDYAYRGYAKNERFYVVGNEVIFNGEAFLSPTYTGISHYDVLDGDTLTIYGKNLHPVFEGMSARILNLHAEITYFDSNRIELIVPSSNYIGTTTATVAIGAHALRTEPFHILGPELNSISKTKATHGDTITISGNNFNPRNEFRKIISYDFSVNLLTLSDTAITFIIHAFYPFEKVDADIELFVGFKHVRYDNILQIQPEWSQLDFLQGNLSPKTIVVGEKAFAFSYDGRNIFCSYILDKLSWHLSGRSCRSDNCASSIPLPFNINGIISNEHIAFFGGWKDDEINKEVWVWNIKNDTWRQFNDLSTDQPIIDGFSQGSQIFLIDVNRKLLSYNFGPEETQEIGEAPFSHLDLYFKHNNKEFVFAVGRLWEFNILTNTWSELMIDLSPYTVRTAFHMNNKLYIITDIYVSSYDLDQGIFRSRIAIYPGGSGNHRLFSFTKDGVAYIGENGKMFSWFD